MTDKEPRRIKSPAEIKVCVECGYEGGLHVIFSPAPSAATAEMLMDLKCPGCGVVHEVGLGSRRCGRAETAAVPPEERSLPGARTLREQRKGCRMLHARWSLPRGE